MGTFYNEYGVIKFIALIEFDMRICDASIMLISL